MWEIFTKHYWMHSFDYLYETGTKHVLGQPIKMNMCTCYKRCKVCGAIKYCVQTSQGLISNWVSDEEAKTVIVKIGEKLGYESLDAGPLKHARYTENMTLFLINLGMLMNKWDMAFKLLQR